PTMTCISRPIPESLSNSWTSIRRQLLPLISYSPAPSRNIRRVIETSEYSMGSALSELSMVSVTSARPSGAREDVPAKMTSSILPPRRVLAPCSPITQVSASTTLDFPDPLGPTTHVMPGSKRRVVGEAKDLKPFSVRLLRCTTPYPTGAGATVRESPSSGRRVRSTRRSLCPRHLGILRSAAGQAAAHTRRGDLVPQR